MKAASYNQRNNGHRKALGPGAPQGSAQYHKWKVAWELEVSHPERSPGLLLACHTEGTLLRVAGEVCLKGWRLELRSPGLLSWQKS